jgi:hypothetical protein
MSILCFAGVCCLVFGKWLIFPMYGGADCLWRLMIGVNDLLYVALECFCITVIHLLSYNCLFPQYVYVISPILEILTNPPSFTTLHRLVKVMYLKGSTQSFWRRHIK